MPTNLELKIKLNSFDEVLKLLKKLKVEQKEKLTQKDFYFRSEKGLLKLRKMKSHCELIRYNRQENSSERWSDYEVLQIHDKKAERILSGIFDVETIVEKRRTVYLFNNTRIHLDSVKHLGKFIELETIVTAGKVDAKKRFNFLVKNLNLNTANQLRLSYRELMLQKARNKIDFI